MSKQKGIIWLKENGYMTKYILKDNEVYQAEVAVFDGHLLVFPKEPILAFCETLPWDMRGLIVGFEEDNKEFIEGEDSLFLTSSYKCVKLNEQKIGD